MALTIDETWVRERVKLKHDHLDDVKSLSLPGTYHEKITSLGTSLRSFTRLKNLDLSRNALQSLEGLESLHLIETLNLYYNNISWLKDMGALKHLTNLKELDLRLNPVTKNEPDYRLYIVHLLPNLKRLDDRSVRDSERRAAVMHFTTDQASEFSNQPVPRLNLESERPVSVPRADMVRNLGPRSALADDDVAVLDLIARTGGDLTQPRGISGSAARGPDIDDFSRDELRNMRNSLGSPPPRHKPETNLTSPRRTSPRQKDRVYVQFADEIKGDANAGLKYADESSAYSSYSTRGHFTPNPTVIGSASSRDFSSQRTSDQIGVRTSDQLGSRTSDQLMARRDSNRDSSRSRTYEFSPRKSQEYDTTSPRRRLDSGVDREGDVGVPHSARSYEVSPSSYDRRQRQTSPVQSQGPAADRLTQHQDESYSRMSVPDQIASELSHSEVLDKLLDLVDRYWNGSKSLHHNSKFIGMANKLFSSMRGSAATPDNRFTPGANEKLKAELSERTVELSRLREQMSEQQKNLDKVRNKMMEQESLQGSLDVATQELMAVKTRLQETQEENSALRTKVLTLEARNTSANEQEKQLEELLRKNNDLEEKVRLFNQQVLQQNQNLEQLQELTTMLQESHRSLVATNDHLLKELDETRQRHNHEVHQLHWSYDKLKNTMDWLPNGTK